MLHLLGDFKGHIKDEEKFFDVHNTNDDLSSIWTVDVGNPSLESGRLADIASATASTRWSHSGGEMKKVPSKAVSERTPVLPFRDRDVRELKGQKNNKLRQGQTVQRKKDPARKVVLSGGAATEPANTLAPKAERCESATME